MTRVVKPSAWINRQVGRRGKVIARAAALLVAGGVAAVLLRSDVIASLTAVAATVAGVMAARWRRPTVFRGVAAGLVFCIAAGAAMVALAALRTRWKGRGGDLMSRIRRVPRAAPQD